MKKADKIKQSYQEMIDWNLYRVKQTQQSLQKLIKLLSVLDQEQIADPHYEKDVDDLKSLKIIYETGIRNFEGQVQKYKELISAS